MSHRPSYREEVEAMRDGYSGGRSGDGWPRENDQAAWRVLIACLAVLAFIVLMLCVIGNVCGADISPSTCRVTEFSRGDCQTTAAGSGVLVAKADGLGYVLTAKHVIEGEPDAKHLVMFPRSEKFAYPVELIHAGNVDLALLVIAAPSDIAPRPIRWQPLAAGERVWQSGFGNEREGGPRESWSNVSPLIRHTAQGETVKYVSPSLLLLSKPARQGDSGGPVIDANGRCVGIISATDESTGYHVTLADQAWLRGLLPENSVLARPR